MNKKEILSVYVFVFPKKDAKFAQNEVYSYTFI